MACGHGLTLHIKVDLQGRTKDARFQSLGCVSVIALSCALTEVILGKIIDEALKITTNDIAE